MRFANWADGEFVNAAAMNTAEDLGQQSTAMIVNGLHTAGLFQTGSAVITAGTGLVLSITLNDPFGIAFGSGTIAQGWGAVDGAVNHVYSVNFASLVPGSGTITAYVIASVIRIGINPQEIVGPPIGHPDYDPAFSPFISYSEIVDSIALTASATPPDNYNTFELCRFPLSAGQTVISSVDITHRLRAGAVLSQNGEVVSADLAPTGIGAGTYRIPQMTVGVDGRLTAASNVLVGTSDLVPTGISAGTYRIPQMTVGVDGRLTAASNVLVGSSDLVPTGVTAATYTLPQMAIGADGRVTSATSFALTFPGNPNGSVAGLAATSGNPATLLFDYANNLVWECTFAGTSSTSQWRVVNGTNSIWVGQTSSAGVTVPNWARTIEAMVVGGGGGGSTCQSSAPYSSTSSSGSGGGAGGFAWGSYLVTAGATLTMVVGTGGATEVDGGTTFISGLLTATGGAGGRFQTATNSAGGIGGVGAGGTIMNTGGSYGSDGQSGAFVFAGNGGAGPWGGAGRAGANAGENATGYGSGGGGAYDSAASGIQRFGGTGFQGIILYRWIA